MNYKLTKRLLHILPVFLFFTEMALGQGGGRQILNFDKGWLFALDSSAKAFSPNFNDKAWRLLDLPHDWSIEGEFSKDNPATPEGGALPGGIGWYRKTFVMPAANKDKEAYIAFDGVYQKSTVWINGHKLGYRPNGYISFRYRITKFLHFNGSNVIAVKADNSSQPNSRWYSGSGIYRHVWLIMTNKLAVDQWGTYVTTPRITPNYALVNISTRVRNSGSGAACFKVNTLILNAGGKVVAETISSPVTIKDTMADVTQQLTIRHPERWSTEHPHLYKVVTKIVRGDVLADQVSTPLGIRTFSFDARKGFTLNGKSMKIMGVCNHHDLGCLGAAINRRALERQLQILKGMGVNAIRTSHNPPAPELLDLCDRMGFMVMDEAFDVWRKQKVEYDYHLYFDQWHERDLADQLLRDRNHPSVIIWSIGNEIPEQADSTGTNIAHDLARIVRKYDDRPIVTANDKPWANNSIVRSGEFELVGVNYHHKEYEKFDSTFPGKVFIGTETTSALETRGVYDMPSDSIRRWPDNKEMKNGAGHMNSDFTVSSYDNVSAPWGSLHEETWKIIKKHDNLNSMFIWTGFDYLGEPTPYTWPARSSYFGVVDMAGFPKDIYYMYKAEWTQTPVLHIFPHWNWPPGKMVDVWAYFNNADEVELFLNGKSLGIRKKEGDDLHVKWRVAFQPGVIRAVSRKNGKTVLIREIKTAGPPAKIELIADRSAIRAGGEDLSFVTVKVLDNMGNVVPDGDNLIRFKLSGKAQIAGTDNGCETDHTSFKSSNRHAFHGLALAVIRSGEQPGSLILTASSDGLKPAVIRLTTR